jgi:hypothetical protein
MFNHFRQRIKSSTSVLINCGKWSNGTATVECDKGATGAVTGTSGDYADTFEVTGISANGWIIAYLNAGTCNPQFTATYPTAATIGSTKFPLCRVEWNSSYSYIEKLEPIWYGGDIVTGGSGSSLQYHFQGEMASSTTVTTHGGKMQIGASTILLGASGVYADTDTKTISASCWVCATLDSSTAPTALSITLETSYPSGAGKKCWPLYYVTFTSGAIVSLEPIWTGGDFVWPIRAIRFNETTGELQGTYLLNPATGIADFTASTDWFVIFTANQCGGATTRSDLNMVDDQGRLVKVKVQVLP